MKSLEEYIGNFGRYQAMVYALGIWVFATACCIMMTFSFSAGVPRVRCFIPGVDDPPSGMERLSSSQQKVEGNITSITNAIYDNPIVAQNYFAFYAKPKLFSNKQSYCRLCNDYNETFHNFKTSGKLIYQNETENASDPEYCSANNSSPCPYGYIYDRSEFESTLVADFDMTCDGAWKRSLSSSFYMIGYLVGALSCGMLSDRFGRRPVLRGLIVSGFITYFGVAFVSNFPLFCLLNLVNGLIGHSISIVVFVVIMEYISGMPATILGVFVQAGFAAGFVYIGVVAYFIRERTMMTIVGALISLTSIPCLVFLPESVRWLYVHGRTSEAKQIIMKAARMNGRVLTAEEIDEIDMPLLDSGKEKPLAVKTVSKTITILDLLFSNFQLTKVSLIVFFCWFACTMTYYGLALNTGELPGNFYVNFIVSGLIEVPGFIIVIPAMEYIGRKPTSIFFFGLTGVCILVSTFIPENLSILKIVFAQIGKMGAATVFAITYNYSSELFPTVTRNAAIGVSSSCARIASISAPQIYYLGNVINTPWFPFTIYGGTAVVAAILVLGLPETKGRKLPETIEDAIYLAKGLSKPTENKRR